MTASTYGAAISSRGLTKDYGNGHGLFDLDLDVERGEVFGFIGANGAGKTTTMRLVMDLIRPDRGTVSVLGLDSRRDSLAIKRRVGYLPGELPQWPGVKAAHIIGLLAGLRGGVDPARITDLADRLQLDLSRRYADLSHGNKQKVGLIAAFMHAPELLILDEPTLGLDPLMQREVRDLVADSVAAGATCLLSSHVLAEVELACDRIGLIRDGRLLRVGSLTELRDVRVDTGDANSELRLVTAMHAAMHGRTTFLIAHRLSTVQNADLIMMLEDGRIVEAGTHLGLKAAGGRYAAFVEAQELMK